MTNLTLEEKKELIRMALKAREGAYAPYSDFLVGAALRADTRDVREMDYTRAAAAIGSEGRGLSQQVLSLCDATVKIPMNDRCESLNAAAAAAALLWEMARG